MRSKVLLVVVLLLVIGSSLATADVVALKRSPGLTDSRGFDASLASAISGGTVSVYTGQSALGDALVYTDQGWAQQLIYANSGAVTSTPAWATVLVNLDTNALPGFAGSTVAKAELRFYTPAGNQGLYNTGYVTYSAWAEGNKTDALYGWGNYPGLDPAAPGVTGAYPSAVNTGPFQLADGTPVDVGYPYDMSKAPFGWSGNQPFGFAKDAASAVSGVAHNPWGVTEGQWDQYVTVDVTSILQLWANGTPNFGLAMDSTGNYGLFLSENATNPDWQPVLVMEYAPTPEPMTLTLLALGGLALIRRRRGV
jgi:MYXO-CTERM domain-containing protein